MRGGHNRKSIEQHIEEGTFRQDRHGIKLNNVDFTRLEIMKRDLFTDFIQLQEKLRNIDIEKNPRLYKTIYKIMMDNLKLFHQLSKNKIVNYEKLFEEYNKNINIDNFKNEVEQKQ